MHDQVNEGAAKQQKLVEGIELEKDYVHKKLQELKQMQGVHDDRMAKYRDEKIMFERKQEQLRGDVREFERLTQDLCKQNQNWILDVKSDFNNKFDSIQNEMDAIKYDNIKVNNFVQATKTTVQKINSSIGLVNYNID